VGGDSCDPGAGVFALEAFEALTVNVAGGGVDEGAESGLVESEGGFLLRWWLGIRRGVVTPHEPARDLPGAG
jgi:hypothetical protein